MPPQPGLRLCPEGRDGDLSGRRRVGRERRAGNRKRKRHSAVLHLRFLQRGRECGSAATRKGLGAGRMGGGGAQNWEGGERGWMATVSSGDLDSPYQDQSSSETTAAETVPPEPPGTSCPVIPTHHPHPHPRSETHKCRPISFICLFLLSGWDGPTNKTKAFCLVVLRHAPQNRGFIAREPAEIYS